MKIITTLCLLALLSLTGCKNESKTEPKAGQQDQETVPEVITDSFPQTSDGHTSENSLDWAGVYKGSLPCNDCPGITTVLTLSADKSYLLSSQAENKEKEPRIFKGSFTWNETGNVITLDAEGDHLKFKVQEGCVTMLDKFSDPKQGGGNYILGKKQ